MALGLAKRDLQRSEVAAKQLSKHHLHPLQRISGMEQLIVLCH